MTIKIEPSHLEDLIRRYQGGESEKALADEADLSRNVLRRRLLAAGVEPRNRSAGMFARMARATPEQRRALTDAAHSAVRGRPATQAQLTLRAATIERLCKSNPAEDALARRLRSHGLLITQLKAVGKYNLDLAIEPPRVAVEIFGGHYHAGGRHFARHWERCEYLLNEAWALVIVWVDGLCYPLGIGCTKYIVTLCDELRRAPSTRRQYRVIFGNGNPAPACESYLNCRADVERLGCRHYAWSGDERAW